MLGGDGGGVRVGELRADAGRVFGGSGVLLCEAVQPVFCVVELQADEDGDEAEDGEVPAEELHDDEFCFCFCFFFGDPGSGIGSGVQGGDLRSGVDLGWAASGGGEEEEAVLADGVERGPTQRSGLGRVGVGGFAVAVGSGELRKRGRNAGGGDVADGVRGTNDAGGRDGDGEGFLHAGVFPMQGDVGLGAALDDGADGRVADRGDSGVADENGSVVQGRGGRGEVAV